MYCGLFSVMYVCYNFGRTMFLKRVEFGLFQKNNLCSSSVSSSCMFVTISEEQCSSSVSSSGCSKRTIYVPQACRVQVVPRKNKSLPSCSEINCSEIIAAQKNYFQVAPNNVFKLLRNKLFRN